MLKVNDLVEVRAVETPTLAHLIGTKARIEIVVEPDSDLPVYLVSGTWFFESELRLIDG